MSTGSFFTEKELNSRSTPKGVDWRHEAECVDSPSHLFDLSPAFEAGDITKAEEKSRLSKTIENYCDHCVVKNDCLLTASRDDRRYTIRGGLIPKGINPANEDLPVQYSHTFEEWECKTHGRTYLTEKREKKVRGGEEVWIVRARCKKCLEHENTKRRSEKRAAVRAAHKEES
jgi:hypothetical protein